MSPETQRRYITEEGEENLENSKEIFIKQWRKDDDDLKVEFLKGLFENSLKIKIDNDNLRKIDAEIMGKALSESKSLKYIKIVNKKENSDETKLFSPWYSKFVDKIQTQARIKKNFPSALTKFSLEGFPILSNSAAFTMISGISNRLTMIALVDAGIDNKITQEMCRAMANTKSLISIDFQKNKIGDEGIKDLAKKVLSTQINIQILSLIDNKITEIGGEIIAKAMENKEYVSEIRLSRNQFKKNDENSLPTLKRIEEKKKDVIIEYCLEEDDKKDKEETVDLPSILNSLLNEYKLPKKYIVHDLAGYSQFNIARDFSYMYKVCFHISKKRLDHIKLQLEKKQPHIYAKLFKVPSS